jgi:hypothetical protein
MNKAVLAAISAAINAYIEQEGQAKAVPSKAVTYLEIRSRRPFGRQELVGARARWRVRGDNRESTGLKLMRKEIQA